MAWAFSAENLPDNSGLLFEEVSKQKKQVKSALKNSSKNFPIFDLQDADRPPPHGLTSSLATCGVHQHLRWCFLVLLKEETMKEMRIILIMRMRKSRFVSARLRRKCMVHQ